MVIELYEKRVLSKQDTEGLDLTWGNTKAVRTLLERIANRQGTFANILAEGTMRAAEMLGAEAQKCGIYTIKGHAPRTHDHRAMWREMFDTATADIGTYESSYAGPPRPDISPLSNQFSPEEVSTHTAKSKGVRQFQDAVGTCVFCNRAALDEGLDAFNAVTGWAFTAKEAQDVGFRVANLMRAFNLRHGVSLNSERPSPRWSSAPLDGPAKGVSVDKHWNRMIDNYYNQMGWERETGKPLPATLKALGLEYVIGDLYG